MSTRSAKHSGKIIRVNSRQSFENSDQNVSKYNTFQNEIKQVTIFAPKPLQNTQSNPITSYVTSTPIEINIGPSEEKEKP